MWYACEVLHCTPDEAVARLTPRGLVELWGYYKLQHDEREAERRSARQ